MTTAVSRKAGEIPAPKKVAIMIVINIIVAATIPLLLDYFNKDLFTLTNEIILGFLIKITLSLSELIYLTQQIYNTDIILSDIWDNKHEIDSVIGNIRKNLHDIIQHQSSDNFYFEHYKSELLWIEGRLRDTIGRKEIVLDRHHINATNALLSIFDSKDHNTFRATHLLWQTGDKFDVTYQVYFKAWIEKLKEGKVREIRRVFVYDKSDDLESKNAKKLLAYHRGTDLALHARIVTRSELNRFKADFNISDGVEDFGIFSDTYLYLGSTRNREQISGRFSKDKSRIENYISCFDALWSSPVAQPLTNYGRETVSEKELFDESFELNNSNPNDRHDEKHK